MLGISLNNSSRVSKKKKTRVTRLEKRVLQGVGTGGKLFTVEDYDTWHDSIDNVENSYFFWSTKSSVTGSPVAKKIYCLG